LRCRSFLLTLQSAREGDNLPEANDTPYRESAERLVELLCEIDLLRWREAAMAAIKASRNLETGQLLNAASKSAKSVRLWHVLDTLDTAVHRLSGRETHGIIRSAAERRSIQTITQQAVLALFLSEVLKPDDLKALTDSFLALIPPKAE
jgi:hypothetical protein